MTNAVLGCTQHHGVHPAQLWAPGCQGHAQEVGHAGLQHRPLSPARLLWEHEHKGSDNPAAPLPPPFPRCNETEVWECPLPRNPVRASCSLFSPGKAQSLFSSSGNSGAACTGVTSSPLQRHTGNYCSCSSARSPHALQATRANGRSWGTGHRLCATGQAVPAQAAGSQPWHGQGKPIRRGRQAVLH